jgi:hypothetical protein
MALKPKCGGELLRVQLQKLRRGVQSWGQGLLAKASCRLPPHSHDRALRGFAQWRVTLATGQSL